MAVEFGQSSIREWLLDTQERSTIEDVTRHGCQGGTISELIYYHDTSAFYEKYQDEIWDKLEDTRADMGLDSIFHLVIRIICRLTVSCPASSCRDWASAC